MGKTFKKTQLNDFDDDSFTKSNKILRSSFWDNKLKNSKVRMEEMEKVRNFIKNKKKVKDEL